MMRGFGRIDERYLFQILSKRGFLMYWKLIRDISESLDSVATQTPR